MQDLRGKALLFAQQAQQQMFGANVLMCQPLRFFRGIGEHALALVRQGKVDRRGNFLADGGVALNLFADRFDRRMGAEKLVGECLILAEKAKQQVLSLDVRRTKLAGLISGKENNAPRLFCIAFEHISPSEDGWCPRLACTTASPD